MYSRAELNDLIMHFDGILADLTTAEVVLQQTRRATVTRRAELMRERDSRDLQEFIDHDAQYLENED